MSNLLAAPLSIENLDRKERGFPAAESSSCVRVLMLVAIRRCRLPNAPIDVMCNQWAKAAYDICPFVNNTHVYDTEGVNSGADYTEALGVIKVGASETSRNKHAPTPLTLPNCV